MVVPDNNSSQEIIFECCDYNRYSRNLQPIFMKSKRLLRHQISHLKPLILFSCFVTLAIIFWFVPPSHPIIITIVIVLVSALAAGVTSLFGHRNITVIVGVFTILFLSMTALVGFDLINTFLLLSFIIALSQLIPTKQEPL